jgi:serine/threonine-protein kinase
MVLMFTDLVDSTRLKRELGPDAYRPMAVAHDRFVRRALALAPSGRILQDTGDGYFVAFDNLSDAVAAALAFQWQMGRARWPVPFASRVGLHLGQVEQLTSEASGQPKYIATAADMAARVMSLAVGGQILLTRAVFDEARQLVRAHPRLDDDDGGAPPALRWVAHGPYLFKGAEEPTEVFEVGADGLAPFVPPPDAEKARRHIRPGDEQTLGWRPAVGLALPAHAQWVLTDKLGEGGFGEVWLARHAKTKNVRVFKFCFDPERLRALKREVVLFRLLKEALGERRDIARVVDFGLDRAPYFIEMEYAPLGNLADWAARRGGVGTVPVARRIELVAQVADALAAAHSVGILHKDIKPSNVLIVEGVGGEVHPRLTDFGIGILTDRERLGEFGITPAGFTVPDVAVNDSSRTGTRMYAPPESLSGRPHTIQGDVYALGVLLYQMAVGDLSRPLAAGWERDVSDEVLRDDVAACVDGDPARRPSSAAELAQRLRTLDARRPTRWQRARRWAGRNRLASALAACVLLGPLAYVAYRWQSPVVVPIETNPVGASIYVDGQLHACGSPCKVRLAPGVHEIRIQHPGDFLPAVRRVRVAWGVATGEVGDAVALAPNFQLCVFRAQPPDARAELRRRGDPPAAPPALTAVPGEPVRVTAGRYYLTYVRPGYVDPSAGVAFDVAGSAALRVERRTMVPAASPATFDPSAATRPAAPAPAAATGG